MRVADIDVARAVIAHEGVLCFSGKEQKHEPQSGQLTSYTGGIFHGRDGEKWPTAKTGQPLLPWLQIVCPEIKELYGPFHRLQVVNFFLHPNFDGWEAMSVDDCGDFVVREYGLDESLVPLVRPSSLTGHPFHRATWAKMQDYPSISKYHELFDDSIYKELCTTKHFEYRA